MDCGCFFGGWQLLLSQVGSTLPFRRRLAEASHHRRARRSRTAARTTLRSFLDGFFFPEEVIIKAIQKLRGHHSRSVLPGRARLRLQEIRSQAGTMAAVPWKCGCGSLNKQSASFCPACGTAWQDNGGSSPRRRSAQEWREWEQPYTHYGGHNAPWRNTSTRPSSPRRRRGGWGAQQPKGKPKGGGSGGKGAGKGKGDGSDTSPTAPQVEALPAPPSTAAPQFPKKPSEASSSNASPEKAQLDALVAMLAASGTAMPESIRSMVAEHQKATTQNLARSLHRAVADQSKARAELQKIRTSRSSYLAAWKQYIDQLSTLLEAQLTDQGTALEAFNAAEIEWIGAEREATVAISRMANKDQVQTEADQDMEDSESKIMEAVEEESRLRQEKEEQQKAGLQLQAALRVARQQAAEHLTQHQRDGSRTPRRKAESETEAPAGREGESVDLTKDGGGSAATPFKLGAASGTAKTPPSFPKAHA